MRVLFGQKNAQTTFLYAMDVFLALIRGQFALIYRNDITLFCKSGEEHLWHNESDLKLLKIVDVTMKLQTCNSSVRGATSSYLVLLLADYMLLENNQSNCGSAIFYNRIPIKGNPEPFLRSSSVCPRAQKLASPLNQRPKKWPSKWFFLYKNERATLDELKVTLKTPPVLEMSMSSGQYIVDLDAEDGKPDCVLLKVQNEMQLKPFGYWLR